MKTENQDMTINYKASQRLFGEKLAHYAQRKPSHFLQLDGFYLPNGGDDFMQPDEDGDCLHGSGTVELMTGTPSVRVLVTFGTDRHVAVRQLKKLAKWLKKHPDLMEYAKPKQADTESEEIPF
jgi:hypothetical protein